MARTRNTTDKHDEALKVFILNDQDQDTKNESLKLFVELYSMRLRSDREFWLVDATSLINDKRGEVRDIVGDLKELKLDLDDDLFILNNDGKAVELFEFYEIHATVPRQILPYGSWTSAIGLLLTDKDKWNRRRNLQVMFKNSETESVISDSTCSIQGMTFKALSILTAPYITRLELVPGSNEFYEMEGLFAEIFFGLQVNQYFGTICFTH